MKVDRIADERVGALSRACDSRADARALHYVICSIMVAHMIYQRASSNSK